MDLYVYFIGRKMRKLGINIGIQFTTKHIPKLNFVKHNK